MPQLAEHQLKAAGVAKIIIDNLTLTPALSQGERGEVVAACLLHDMGNIIKFDLNNTQRLINQNIDLEYWQKVKDEFLKKYGSDEHYATILIAEEIGANGRVIELIDAVGFLTAPQNARGEDLGKKICQYADDRVAPRGIVSLEERFMDLRNRYQHHKNNTQARDDFEDSLYEIEKQIFAHCKIRPEEITEEAIKSEIEKLRNFEIGDK